MEGGETWGRYSFIGVKPELFLEADHSAGATGGLELLRTVYKDIKVADIDGLPRFFGGAVGYIGYEGVGEFEKLPHPKKASGIVARSRFLKADQVIVFDNVRHTVKIVVSTQPRSTKGSDSGGQDAYDDAVERINGIIAVLERPVKMPAADCVDKVEFVSNVGPDEYKGMVAAAKKYIYNGDIIQVVLSQRFTADVDLSAVQLYRALRLLNPSPYTFFLKRTFFSIDLGK